MKTFPSTLIISSCAQTLSKEINDLCLALENQFNPNNPDIALINQETGWGIDQIRSLKHFLSQKPFAHQNKIAVIENAQNLNLESQNALLKTLEEPGENNYIILTAPNTSSLLPTIISRCHIKKNPKSKIQISQIKPLEITGDILKDLSTSENLSKNKDDVLPLLKEQLELHQQLLISQPSNEIAQNTKKIIKAIQLINANVDPRNALDYFFLG